MIKVLVVDDSAVARQAFNSLLRNIPGVEVMACVPDPIFAQERMARAWPDVILLDVEMPRMDGITFLRKLMAERPTPVIICSSRTAPGAAVTQEAIQAGAAEVLLKPRLDSEESIREAASVLGNAIKKASKTGRSKVAPPSGEPTPLLAAAQGASDRLVAIGTSMGGTQALEVLLSAFPATCPPIVIVQHMPEKFTAAFAARLNSLCSIEVREARDGDRLAPGLALIAQGGRHLRLKKDGLGFAVEVFEGPRESRHCPSVDVLFQSVAQVVKGKAMGVLLTGMGNDGAKGLLAMREAGSLTVAQDEATSMVYGMPREAVKLGAAEKVLPLGLVASEMMRWWSGK